MTLGFFEQEALSRGYKRIAGVDEAGCGSLCGPVLAAAVILDLKHLISDIDDSKKLNPKKRESLYKKIKEKAIGWSIGIASAGEIDRINIRQASLRAMQRAVRKLKPQPDFLLVDGFTIPWLNIPQKGIVKGDCQSFSIAAASILAKVSRDKIMMDYHFLHPQYNLRRNKGYPTLEHREALKKNGASPLHRQSYRLFS